MVGSGTQCPPPFGLHLPPAHQQTLEILVDSVEAVDAVDFL